MPPTPFWWMFRFTPREVYFICSKKSHTTKSKKKKPVRFEYQAVCRLTRGDLGHLTLDYFTDLCSECLSCRTLDWIPDPHLRLASRTMWEVAGASWTLREDTSYLTVTELDKGASRSYEYDFGRCTTHV